VARQARRAKGTSRYGDVKNGTELADTITVAALGPGDKGRLRQPLNNTMPFKGAHLILKPKFVTRAALKNLGPIKLARSKKAFCSEKDCFLSVGEVASLAITTRHGLSDLESDGQ
jgi:hypothetical protein